MKGLAQINLSGVNPIDHARLPKAKVTLRRLWHRLRSGVSGSNREGVRIRMLNTGRSRKGGSFVLSGQAGHGRAGRLVLFSLCGSPEKVQNGADIVLWPLLIGVVAAFGEDSQFTPWKVSVKGNGLFHVKDGTAVGIEHEGRAAHRRKIGPQIKIA